MRGKLEVRRLAHPGTPRSSALPRPSRARRAPAPPIAASLNSACKFPPKRTCGGDSCPPQLEAVKGNSSETLALQSANQAATTAGKRRWNNPVVCPGTRSGPGKRGALTQHTSAHGSSLFRGQNTQTLSFVSPQKPRGLQGALLLVTGEAKPMLCSISNSSTSSKRHHRAAQKAEIWMRKNRKVTGLSQGEVLPKRVKETREEAPETRSKGPDFTSKTPASHGHLSPSQQTPPGGQSLHASSHGRSPAWVTTPS